MFRRIAFAITCVLAAVSATQVEAAIVIQNPSFETPNIGNGAFSLNGINGSGWTTGNTYLLDNNTTQNAFFSTAVPNGQQVNTLAINSFMSQQLNDSVTGAVLSNAGLSFDISFYVGRRSAALYGAPGLFEVRLQEFNGGTWTGIDYATQRYQTATDANPATIDLNITQGFWTLTPVNLRLTIPTGLNGGTVGRNVRITFVNMGTQGEGSIDSVSVTAVVPEPSTATLMLCGSAGLFWLRRKKAA